MTAAPTGESIWRWQAITQGSQVVALWAITRVFEPTFAVNTFVLLGWIVTGIAAYVLARIGGASVLIALGVGVLCQMLPSLPTMASNYTSYVYIGVPLLVLAAAICVTTDPSWLRLGILVASLTATAFFDPYWLFFAFAIVVLAGALNARTLRPWFAEQPMRLRLLLLASMSAPAVLIGAVVTLDRLAPTGSRPLGVADANLVRAGLRDPADWLQWEYEGVGLLVSLLATGYAALILWRRNDRRLMTIASVGILFAALSTRTSISLGVLEVGSLAEYVRFVMPGVRFFQRAALITEAVMCLLAVLAIRDFARKVDSDVGRRILGGIAFVLVVTSLSPWGGRAVFRPAPVYSSIQGILDKADDPVLATLPAERVGRSWFELSLLNVAAVNGLRDLEPGQTVERAASQGAEALAAYLASQRVTHFLSVEGADGLPLSFALEPPRFLPLLSFPVSGFEFDDMIVTLYEVRKQEGDRYCATCPSLRRGFLNGENYPLEELSPGNTAWWMYGAYSAMTVETYGEPLEGVLRIRIGNTPCGDARTVTVRTGETRRSKILTGQEIATIDIPLGDVGRDVPIEFLVEGTQCRVDGDNRDFSLQIFQPRLILDD